MAELCSSDCQQVLRIRLLGPPSFSVGGIPLAELHGSPGLQGLLSYLIVHRGQWLDRSRVAGTFWPEVTEEKARRALNTQLWRLRWLAQGRMSEAVHSRRNALMWQSPTSIWLDLDEWDALTGRGTEAIEDPASEEALARLERQCALYRGPLLDGLDIAWGEEERYRYAVHYVALLRTIGESYAARGHLEKAIRWVRRWVAVEPYDEGAHDILIRLHQRNGQPSLAHIAHRGYQSLWAELGVPASPAIAALLEPEGSASEVPVTGTSVGADTIASLLAPLAVRVPPAVQERLARFQEHVRAEAEQAALDIAVLHESAFDWPSACRAYETALALAEQQGDTPAQKRQCYTVRLKLDSLYDQLADRDAQRTNCQQLLVLAEALHCPALESEAWARYCWLDQRVGKLDNSLYAASRALGSAGNSPALRAQALRLLGSSHEFMGSFSLSVRANLEALTCETEHTPATRLSRINLISGLLALDEPWQAIDHSVTALAGTRGSPPTAMDILVLGNGAVAYLTVGSFSTAEEQLRRAITYAKLLNARGLEAWLLARSATLYRWIGASQAALFAATEGWKLAREADNDHVAIEAAIDLGLLSGAHGDWKAARRWVERIEELPTALARGRHRGRLTLLRAYLAAEGEEPSGARAAGLRVLEHIEQTGEERLRLPTLALLAHLSPTEQGKLHRSARERQAALLARAPDDASRAHYIGIAPLRQWAEAPAAVIPPLSWLW